MCISSRYAMATPVRRSPCHRRDRGFKRPWLANGVQSRSRRRIRGRRPNRSDDRGFGKGAARQRDPGKFGSDAKVPSLLAQVSDYPTVTTNVDPADPDDFVVAINEARNRARAQAFRVAPGPRKRRKNSTGKLNAYDLRASPSHHQIVRHMGNDPARRMVRNQTEIVGRVLPRRLRRL